MANQSSAGFKNEGVDRDTQRDESIDIATLHEFSNLLRSQPNSQSCRRQRQIQKVPPHIRQRREQVYDPAMVSFGPYHHGKPGLRQAEEFKHLCLDRSTGGNERKKAFFYSKILDQIDEIKGSYAEVSILERYDDKTLALMMLLDASIIVDFMHNFISMKGSSFLAWQRCLGAGSGPLIFRDMMMIENQIPFHILRSLIGLQYDDAQEADLFLPRFLSQKTGMELKHVMMVVQDIEDPPLHFLEAFWRVVVNRSTHMMSAAETRDDAGRFLRSGLWTTEVDNVYSDTSSYTHRSVMDLKAKGIRVRPNSTRSPIDITFRPSACFSHLCLPIQYVSDFTYVIWSNMIAFEVQPNATTSLIMLSYVIFMKSLIQSAEDVKELQDNGIMLNRLANLEKVVEMMKDIDTFGLHDLDVFKDVKRRIEEHCRSRARTWIVELVYTRFRTPWTVVAFFAAGLLLCLTFLQTIYTIHR